MACGAFEAESLSGSYPLALGAEGSYEGHPYEILKTVRGFAVQDMQTCKPLQARNF